MRALRDLIVSTLLGAGLWLATGLGVGLLRRAEGDLRFGVSTVYPDYYVSMDHRLATGAGAFGLLVLAGLLFSAPRCC